MPYASVTPLPISVLQVRGRFAALKRQLTAMAREEIPDAGTDDDAVELFLTSLIRAAQYVLEDMSRTAFFVTRYCTRELATQLGLTLGQAGSGGYDEELSPQDYDVGQWRRASGRTELARGPLISIQTFRLSLTGDNKLADIPVDWINPDYRKSIVHILPGAFTSLSATFYTIFAIHPMLVRPGLGEITPLLVHTQYQAGLCERTATNGTDPYDPTALIYNTRWNQAEVHAFKAALQDLAAATVARRLAPVITRGGVQLAIDGVSRSANPEVLLKNAAEWEGNALKFAARQKEVAQGVGAVFA